MGRPWYGGAAVEVYFSKKLSLDLSKNKLIPTQYNNIVDNTQVGLGKPCGYQVGVPPRIPVSNLPPHHAFLPASNQLDSNYFACLGYGEEMHDNVFVFNVLPDFSDYNMVCASNTTYGADYGTMTAKDDCTTYAGECTSLITNVAGFSQPRGTPHAHTTDIMESNSTGQQYARSPNGRHKYQHTKAEMIHTMVFL